MEGLSIVPERRQLLAALVVRVSFATIFLIATVLFRLGGESGKTSVFLYFIATFSFLCAFFVGVLLKRSNSLPVVAQLLTVWDIVFATMLVLCTGVVYSPFVPLYSISIVGASLYLSRNEILLAASASSINVGALISFQYYGIVPWGIFDLAQITVQEAFYSVFANLVAIFLSALLSLIISKRYASVSSKIIKASLDFRELNELNTKILDNISAGIMVINKSGRIRLFNRAAEAITGYSIDNVYNREVALLFPGMIPSRGVSGNVSRCELEFVQRDGEEKILGYSVCPLNYAGGSSERKLLITFRDLTQIKLLEQKVKRQEQVAAMGRLASGLAHEVRNPLASISSAAQLLMQKTAKEQTEIKMLSLLVRESDRLNRLLSDFLDFARPSAPRLADVRLDDVFDEVLMLVSTDTRGNKVTIEREENERAVWRIDREQFVQVVWNLILNAIDAAGPGGVVKIGMIDDRTLVVEDSGSGLDPVVAERIFEPFFTTKEKGTGLGLSRSHSIILNHGGSIMVKKSTLGGCSFQVNLPLLAGENC